MSVTFIERTGKSWSVKLKAPKAFNNSRGPHVETAEEGLAGKTFTLGSRQTKDQAVMYLVNGVKNGSHSAHITVFFGDPKEHSKY